MLAILCEYYGGPSHYGSPYVFPVRYALSKKKCNFRQVTKVVARLTKDETSREAASEY